ncbi:MAG: radical SAM protein [Bacilli bacterium]|nr:radical SAM protein [Bacilli bacterium]MDD4077263.1 radical SAM protein [Bacilli bacterium]MDD4388323.1 radical SAM protein [Bacilli bacterium]
MKDYKYIYGPIPSRRLGRSLGIAPIPVKTCNYSCVYCQLGRTDKMTLTRQMFYPVQDILAELKDAIQGNIEYDVVSVVGNGEPTLYSGLGTLIQETRKYVAKPIAVITNGALLYDSIVRSELKGADIVMPSLDAYDEISFHQINRGHHGLSFERVLSGIIEFSHEYTADLWLEIMIIAGVNDSDESLEKLRDLTKLIRFNRLYINTPIRPPAEPWVTASTPERLSRAACILGGTSIEHFSPTPYQSGIDDDYRAVISLIGRHAMREQEIISFLRIRGNLTVDLILNQLKEDNDVEKIHYQDTIIFRTK